MKPKITGIFFLFSLISVTARSQNFIQDMEIGAAPGIYIYQGDLAPSVLGSLKTPRFGFNIWTSKPVRSNVDLRLSFSIASLRGDESKYSNPEYRQERNLKFDASIKELMLLAVWTPPNFRSKVSPYVFGGLGVSLTNIDRDASGYNLAYFGDGPVTENLVEDMNTKTPRVLPVLPLGAGARYPLSARLSVYLESTFRVSRSDYLDGFSKVANPKRKDNYHSTNAGLIYSFSKNNKKTREGCPVVN
jgi:hypothetical protein